MRTERVVERRVLQNLTHTPRRTVTAFILLCALMALARADVIKGRVVGTFGN
jgi:hypothetical protein